MAKKTGNKKTRKAAKKTTEKKVARKKQVAKKAKRQVSAEKAREAKSVVKKAAAVKPKPAAKRTTGKPENKKAKASQPSVKQMPVKTELPFAEEQKPKGSPTQLSMALEEKETQPVIVKPRVTRSKSGNLLFQLEYSIRSSPAILYEFLTTPSGLAQWFADSVDIYDHHCSFVWEGVEEKATIIDSIPDEYVRYRWDNSDEDEYFEFRISKNEITSDTILTITDFASESEINDQKRLWDSQVKILMQQIGG